MTTDGSSLASLTWAALAAVLAAALWAVVTWLTDYEVGYFAIGVGFIVGLAAARAGGRGTAVATGAAGLTILAVLGGKLIATKLYLERELSGARAEYFGEVQYREVQRDALAWQELGPDASNAELTQFIPAHQCSKFIDPDGSVSANGLAAFREGTQPYLAQFVAQAPTFEEWQAAMFGLYRSDVLAEVGLLTILIENLDLFDVLFVALALSTAFRLVPRETFEPLPEDGFVELEEPAESDEEMRRAA